MPEPQHCQRVNVLGVGLSVINRQTALQMVLEALSCRTRGYISVTGVHGVMEAQTDEPFRRILNQSFLCTPDGMPMVWMGRLAGHREMRRVYGPDFMLDVCAASVDRKFRHFLYGGAPGVATHLRQRLETRFPGLQIVGVYEPPFRPLNPQEDEELRLQIEACKPDMLWVGLSTPKQEKFMSEYLPRLQVTLMAGVGAAFDFHTGRVRQAPLWMQRCGLEWFFRVCQEPRRLWKRYLKNNPRFVLLAIAQILRFRKFELR